MSKIVCSLGCTALLVAGVCGEAAAQTRASAEAPAFLNVAVGTQPQQRTLDANSSFSLYDETATIAAIQQIKNGALIEVGGGYHLTPRFAIAAAFSSFGRPGTGTITASIPDPIFFDNPSTVTQNAGDLAHTERGIHLQAVYIAPLSPKFDVALSAGPSLIRVSQQLATASVATSTQSVTVTTTTATGTAKGFNAGMQANYMFAPRYGVGVFFGYVGASVDLPGAADVKAGGVRTGLALNVRF